VTFERKRERERKKESAYFSGCGMGVVSGYIVERKKVGSFEGERVF
jgi:hypothetical protein